MSVQSTGERPSRPWPSVRSSAGPPVGGCICCLTSPCEVLRRARARYDPYEARDRAKVRSSAANDTSWLPDLTSVDGIASVVGKGLVEEVQVPLSDTGPVVRIRSTRSTQHLVDSEGAVLAELSLDKVRAESLLATTTPASWTEMEVELTEDADSLLLDLVDKALHKNRRGPPVCGRTGARPWWTSIPRYAAACRTWCTGCASPAADCAAPHAPTGRCWSVRSPILSARSSSGWAASWVPNATRRSSWNGSASASGPRSTPWSHPAT